MLRIMSTAAPRSTLPVIALALIGPLVACTTSNAGGGGTGTVDGNTTTEVACDPLAAKPIALGAVVGVGKDASGTLYVDAASGVFVSGGGKLLRQHVTGTGQSGTSEFAFGFEPAGDDGTHARSLLVETKGSIATAMALGPTNSKAFLSQSPAGVTPLTLVDAATVSGMMLVNTPNLISYIGDAATGDVVLATVPMNEDLTSTNGGLSIFYGPPNGVAQRTVTSLEQSLSNNGTVTFLVGTTPYVLAFGVVQAPDAGPFGVFTLEGLTPQGGAQIAVTLRSPTPTATPSDLSFTCLP